jgi:hypothetical protein
MTFTTYRTFKLSRLIDLTKIEFPSTFQKAISFMNLESVFALHILHLYKGHKLKPTCLATPRISEFFSAEKSDGFGIFFRNSDRIPNCLNP